MKSTSLAVGFAGYLLTDVAVAGTTTVLGTPLGITLGSALPIVGLLSVAAASLVVGIRIVRRKR
jgi:hypothetical protein